ncbi:hypothetical protein SH668x_002536 [Planctomicrobium sp. SH668]|uniref:hypothetical protein n=1 Tax=Planctomicrobium sp. SH668 TaxID=3448126 RepID=UPI003F5BC34A
MPSRQQLNRLLVALVAIGCLFAGLAIGILHQWSDLWCGSFIRSGLLLIAFWIGMPTKGRAAAWANVSPWWTLGVIGGLILITRVFKEPKVLIPIVGAIGFLSFIVPMFTQRQKRN